MGQLNETAQSTKDCILRQDAIDAARDTLKRLPTASIRMMDAIQNIPSAQPKTQLSTEDTTFDCISRQAAMVAFECSGLDDDSKDTVVRVLEQLPSAQPEVIRCKDCIHYKDFAFIKMCDVFDWRSTENDFCSFAERRTDDSISD